MKVHFERQIRNQISAYRQCLSSRVEWFILKLNPCFEHVVIFVNILQFYETTSIVPLKTWKALLRRGQFKID